MTGLQVLLIVMVAMTIFAGVWIIGECFDSWGDFIKSLTDKEYNYLSFVFRKGKHIRFITDFPNDLRRECLGKDFVCYTDVVFFYNYYVSINDKQLIIIINIFVPKFKCVAICRAIYNTTRSYPKRNAQSLIFMQMK